MRGSLALGYVSQRDAVGAESQSPDVRMFTARLEHSDTCSTANLSSLKSPNNGQSRVPVPHLQRFGSGPGRSPRTGRKPSCPVKQGLRSLNSPLRRGTCSLTEIPNVSHLHGWGSLLLLFDKCRAANQEAPFRSPQENIRLRCNLLERGLFTADLNLAGDLIPREEGFVVSQGALSP